MSYTIIYIILISLFIFSFEYKIDEERKQLIDDTIDSLMKDARLKNVGLIITNLTSTLHQKIYGEADKINVETPFIIGSVSKSFTALSILKLNISLDQTLDKFDLGDYIDEKFAKKTTISELLNHTSGLAKFTSQDIGTKGNYSYSNYGYSLLGKIIEKVSKKKYSEYIQEKIFTPLQMNNSYAVYDKKIVDSYDNFLGFTTKYTSLKSEIGDGFNVPAGYISVSMQDMGQYLRFYLDPENEEYTSQITSESVKTGYNSYYGMGMNIVKNDFYTKYEHNGATVTFLCNLYIYPKLELAFFIVTNSVDYVCSSNAYNLFISVQNLIVYGSLDKINGSSFFSNYFTLDVIVLLIISLPLTYLIITIVRIIKRKKSLWFIGVKGKIILGVDIVVLIIFPLILIIYFYADPNMYYLHFIKDILFCLFMFCSCLMVNFLLKLIYVFVYKKYFERKEFEKKNNNEEMEINLME
jgi:hypothetical protein